jgi:hypothetical protein
LQDVSQAFLMLAGELTLSELPPKLQELTAQEWKMLVHLLSRLNAEKLLNQVH